MNNKFVIKEVILELQILLNPWYFYLNCNEIRISKGLITLYQILFISKFSQKRNLLHFKDKWFLRKYVVAKALLTPNEQILRITHIRLFLLRQIHSNIVVSFRYQLPVKLIPAHWHYTFMYELVIQGLDCVI